MDGLAAPSRRARALCRDCFGRWTVSPAIHHEKDGQGTALGIHPCAYRTRSDLAILGSACRPSLAGSLVCIPGTTKSFTPKLATKNLGVWGRLGGDFAIFVPLAFRNSGLMKDGQ